jgi:hypothetical protein
LYDPQMPGGSKEPSPLFSTPLLAQVGLSIHTGFNIIICTSCGVAWKPSRIIGHIRRTHHIKITKVDEAKVMALIDGHKITDDTPVITPMPKLAPVELIKVHENGFCCNICDYCCLNERTFDNHWSNEHRTLRLKPSKRFHHSNVQTFFDPLPIKYFEVLTCLRQVPIGSAFDIYVKNEVPNQPTFQPTIPLKDREIPPFLHVTQWHMHLAKYLTNEMSRKALREIVQLPKGLQKDPLHNVVTQYMHTVSKQSSEMAYQLRCLLIECPRCV